MQGYRVLWVPGCDHAGIATQVRQLPVFSFNDGIGSHFLNTVKVNRIEFY